MFHRLKDQESDDERVRREAITFYADMDRRNRIVNQIIAENFDDRPLRSFAQSSLARVVHQIQDEGIPPLHRWQDPFPKVKKSLRIICQSCCHHFEIDIAERNSWTTNFLYSVSRVGTVDVVSLIQVLK